MRGGFKRLVHPTSVLEIDLDATRDDRDQLHEEIELRDHLAWLLAWTSPGAELVRVTPYRLVEGDESADAAS